MKKRVFALLQAFVLLTAASACGSSDTENSGLQAVENPKVITMATGDPTGSYYAFGNLLGGYMGEASGTNISVISTEGSAANIAYVNDGLSQLGMAQSDIMAYAWDGDHSFAEKGQMQNFRALGGLYEEAVQIVTLDESIETVADLKGRVVSVGAEDSGVYFNALDILHAYGITEEEIDAEYLTFGEAVAAMKAGDVDAAFMVSGAPTNAIANLTEQYDVHLVSIEGKEAENLIEEHPYYNKYVVLAGTYEGLDRDVTTISVQATMIVSADLSEEDVYNLTAGIFENTESISAILTRGIDMSTENGTTGISVPFHKGAAKYFAEKGFTVSAES